MDKPVAKRIRRDPADLRAEALAAARRLILEGGPDALTLRAVAEAVGVTYPNLSHHFGSASGLHAAVAEELVGELLSAVRSVGGESEALLKDPRRVVDIAFDLFGRDGLARLIDWLSRFGDDGGAERVRGMIGRHVVELEQRRGLAAGELEMVVPRLAMVLAMAAYAEATVGEFMGQAIGLSAEQRRAAVADALLSLRGPKPY